MFFDRIGVKREEIIVTQLLRCHSSMYPKGKLRKTSETICRVNDATLQQYSPSAGVITYSFRDVLKEGVFYRLVLADLRKALWLSGEGYRPLVLMGQEAVDMVYPWASRKGGLKSWRGHWWEMEGWQISGGGEDEKS